MRYTYCLPCLSVFLSDFGGNMFILFVFLLSAFLSSLFFIFATYVSEIDLKYTKKFTENQKYVLITAIGCLFLLFIFQKEIYPQLCPVPKNGYVMKIPDFESSNFYSLFVMFYCVCFCFMTAGKKQRRPDKDSYIFWLFFIPIRVNRKKRKYRETRVYQLLLKSRPLILTIIFFAAAFLNYLINIEEFTYYVPGEEIGIYSNRGIKTQYSFNDIEDVELNSYLWYGKQEKYLNITFTDGRSLRLDSKTDGSKRFLYDWKGEIRRTEVGKEERNATGLPKDNTTKKKPPEGSTAATESQTDKSYPVSTEIMS